MWFCLSTGIIIPNNIIVTQLINSIPHYTIECGSRLAPHFGYNTILTRYSYSFRLNRTKMPISDSQYLSIYLLTRGKTYERKGFRNTSQSHNVWSGWPNYGPKFDQATRILFWCSESSIARDWTTQSSSSGQREAKEGDNHRTWIACLLLNTAE